MSLEIEPGDSTSTCITKAVFQLMQTTDIDRIAVSDVIRIAKVSRSTFYRYFDSVDDVVKVFENSLLADLQTINESALKLRFSSAELEPTAAMISRMETIHDHREGIVALNGPHGDPTFSHRTMVFMHQYFLRRLKNVPGDETHRDMYLAFIIQGHDGLIDYWLEKRPDIPAKTVAAMLCRLYYAPLYMDKNSVREQIKFPEFED
ncbi:MAG: TetR/AcrR family transcriptional regulator [Atopobium sp.]|uniref:TetR/AcrR family transcriptional regulator n=1 Tax=Atopobium sp. TaxID=1872650 RepID=UPI002A7604BA|nr:TetR/AcrR family transcriptional regulator [Atopobium sp.]MDY2789077.1 TetR/AcrR family transcriptional regulator [Atopobium sp.]